MTDCRLILGDCVEAMAELDDDSIDAIVCDPPYGLEFMGKDWDSFRIDKRSARWAGTERTGGAGAGFGELPGGTSLPAFGRRRTTSLCRTCGKRDAFRNDHACGDASDWVTIPVDESPMEMRAFQNWVALWAVEAYRILKPGGHLLAFGGTRTYHRLACGVEEAGFDIRDSLHWIYGSGFPKSLDVSKQLDKAAGVDVTADERWKATGRDVKPRSQGRSSGVKIGQLVDTTHTPGAAEYQPVTDAAIERAGWGTALKPAHEPILLARKPLAGTVAETVLTHGTGALNLKGCEIGTTGGTASDGPPNYKNKVYGEGMGGARSVPAGGRWPSNVALGHLPDCQGSGPHHTDVLCVEGCPVAELNDMSGWSETPAEVGRGAKSGEFLENLRDETQVYAAQGDAGGAARFFYIAKPRRRERIGGTVRNLHPTVKPIELMRWLVRLVTPPGGVVLDPFLGSGTTGCAAMVEGFRFVGIERDEDSFDTAAARIGDWAFRYDRERPVRT